MSDGASRIAEAFAVGRPLFVPYVMGGYPDVVTSLRYAEALAPHADILELGVPFSDPLADGPTIQAAGQAALEAGTHPGDVLDIAASMVPAHEAFDGALHAEMTAMADAAGAGAIPAHAGGEALGGRRRAR